MSENDELNLSDEQIKKFEKICRHYNDFLVDRLIEHIEDDEYFQNNFSNLSGKKFSNLMDFIIEVHQHGVFGGMLINEFCKIKEPKVKMKFIKKIKQ